MKTPYNNPLLIKELREEVRSKKIFFLVPVYIAILSTVAIVAINSSTGVSFNPLMLAGNARITMFSFVITITILIGLISAVFGAASFTTEREKATYELLELTPLSYVQLILGKFLHAFVITILILISSLPVISTLFFMGGLTYVDVLLTLFYLALFFVTVILGSICISIISSRTILSIILSLGLGFALSVLLGVLSGGAFRQPEDLGFAVLSPWLVTWQQIFSPTPMKLAGIEFPIWPFYFLFYALLTLLFLAWGRNALDTRKLERNPWTRILGLVFVNSYISVGVLCARSYHSFTVSDMEGLYQAMMLLLIVSLPFFATGILTDKDNVRFTRHPLIDSFHPGRLWLNYPPTGFLFLFVLLLSITANLTLTSGLRWKVISPYLSEMALWMAPWLLIFVALRLWGTRGRMLFVTYLFGTLLCTVISVFWHSRKAGASSNTIFDFYLTPPNIILITLSGLICYALARRQSKQPRWGIANA